MCAYDGNISNVMEFNRKKMYLYGYVMRPTMKVFNSISSHRFTTSSPNANKQINQILYFRLLFNLPEQYRSEPKS